MQSVVELMQVVLGAVGELASTSKVVGEPVTVEGHTIIPLCKLSVGFAGGGGGGKGADKEKPGEGEGAGTGAGVRVEPVAVLAITPDGVSMLTIGERSGILAQAIEAVPEVLDKIQGLRKKDADKED